MNSEQRNKIYDQGSQLTFTVFGYNLSFVKDWYHIYKLYVDDKKVSKEIVDYYNLQRFGIEEITNAHWYSMISNLWISLESPGRYILDSFYTFLRPSPYLKDDDYTGTKELMCRNSDMNFMMNNDELKIFNALPNSFKVYRGLSYSPKEEITYDEGLSWTLLEEKAQWFSKRHAKIFDGKPMVLELEVYKDVPYPEKVGDKPKAVAYLNGRKEQEIIVYNNSKSEFAKMPPWEKGELQEYFLDEELNQTEMAYEDYLENGFTEPPSHLAKRNIMEDMTIGNGEVISYDRYKYHDYLIFEYLRRGIEFDGLPIEIAKNEGADELFIKDMEYRNTIIPTQYDPEKHGKDK